MRHINEIIIHCTATPQDWRKGQRTSTKVKEVTRWHVEDRGWSDIGYTYLIDRDGTVQDGRPIHRAGAHVKGRNGLLAASDWTQVADAPVDRAAWADYRQALRNITSQAGFPENIIWPTQPRSHLF